jgi:hypothetical protein
MRIVEFTKQSGDTSHFTNGWYIAATGEVFYTKKELPFVMTKMVNLHKAPSANSLGLLNTVFGITLFLFVLSGLLMFPFQSKAFKKGMIYTAIGLALSLVLIFV